ncbi:CaiB/BaiF CoA transferase family protein [Candidatus Poriferisodalis sp.]|uniref:CaiB/BaiF CoA transferase family protein n=1 Tax=Candidatus Poriferisodalis sp. TaxID=3101277 RepID=UPI003B0134B7
MSDTAGTAAAAANEAAGALDGVRVVDLTTVLMGPMACRMLGDHGADVIRVESLDGDSTRNGLPARSAGMSGFSLNIQRNKRSLALDLKSDAGRAAMQRLLASSDVLITNMRAAALERLGLDADSLRAQHPQLICCRANGYGSGGPYRDKAAYDDAIQAASGLSNLIGRIAGEPGFVPSVIADKVTGLHVVEAVLAALFHRERTGVAQAIEVPMFETMVAFNLVEHYRGAVFEPPEGPFGYDRLLTPHRRPYPTADGWVCLLPYNDAQYRAFFAFVEQPELADDPRFADHNSRIAHIDELYALFGELSVRRTTDEWIAYCDTHSIPAARVMDLADLDADPQLAAVGLVSISEHPTEGAYRYVADPVVYSATPTRLRRHAPRLGEHALEILSELGYGGGEIDALLDQGVIVLPD